MAFTQFAHRATDSLTLAARSAPMRNSVDGKRTTYSYRNDSTGHVRPALIAGIVAPSTDATIASALIQSTSDIFHWLGI